MMSRLAKILIVFSFLAFFLGAGASISHAADLEKEIDRAFERGDTKLLVLFYHSPGCPVCEETWPKYLNFLQKKKYRNYGLRTWAIYASAGRECKNLAGADRNKCIPIEEVQNTHNVHNWPQFSIRDNLGWIVKGTSFVWAKQRIQESFPMMFVDKPYSIHGEMTEKESDDFRRWIRDTLANSGRVIVPSDVWETERIKKKIAHIKKNAKDCEYEVDSIYPDNYMTVVHDSRKMQIELRLHQMKKACYYANGKAQYYRDTPEDKEHAAKEATRELLSKIGIEMAKPPVSSEHKLGHGLFWPGMVLVSLGGISAWQASEAANREAAGNWSEGKTRKAWTGSMWASFSVGATMMVSGIVLWILDSLDKPVVSLQRYRKHAAVKRGKPPRVKRPKKRKKPSVWVGENMLSYERAKRQCPSGCSIPAKELVLNLKTPDKRKGLSDFDVSQYWTSSPYDDNDNYYVVFWNKEKRQFIINPKEVFADIYDEMALPLCYCSESNE